MIYCFSVSIYFLFIEASLSLTSSTVRLRYIYTYLNVARDNTRHEPCFIKTKRYLNAHYFDRFTKFSQPQTQQGLRNGALLTMPSTSGADVSLHTFELQQDILNVHCDISYTKHY